MLLTVAYHKGTPQSENQLALLLHERLLEAVAEDAERDQAQVDARAVREGEPAPGEGLVRRVRFASDGKSVLTASHDGTTRLWSLNGVERARFVVDPAIETKAADLRRSTGQVSGDGVQPAVPYLRAGHLGDRRRAAVAAHAREGRHQGSPDEHHEDRG